MRVALFAQIGKASRTDVPHFSGAASAIFGMKTWYGSGGRHVHGCCRRCHLMYLRWLPFWPSPTHLIGCRRPWNICANSTIPRLRYAAFQDADMA